MTHLLLPKQTGQDDSCSMEGIEDVSEIVNLEYIVILVTHRNHPLPPPPEVSVSQDPDVAVSVPHLTPHSPPHRAQCLGVRCLSSRLLCPTLLISHPRVMCLDPRPTLTLTLRRFIEILVRFYNFRAPLCVKVKESLIDCLIEDLILNTCSE